MLHQDESTGKTVDDEGRTVDVRPGAPRHPIPTYAQAEALDYWRRTYDPHYTELEFKHGSGHIG